MGFKSLGAFESTRQSHTNAVRNIYDEFFGADGKVIADGLPRDFHDNETVWKNILARHSFRDPERALWLIQTFVEGPGHFHISPRSLELSLELLNRMLAMCPRKDRPLGSASHPPVPTAPESGPGVPPKSPAVGGGFEVLSDPDRVLARMDSFISAYGARATLLETWSSNPSLFKLLLLLFDRSEFLAEIAIRVPDLVDELELSGYLRRRKNTEKILEDLRHGWNDENQRLWLRRYHQTEFMRLGLRDILGLADFEQNLVELTALGEACLQYALDVVLRKRGFKTPPLVIIGMGKLGGTELTYGSDLDLMFVADPRAKTIAKLQPIAVEVMDLLSSKTELGIAFTTDARLRPDGEKGLLVNSVTAYEEYYRRRAMLWEIQALTRARPVAGSMELGRQFAELAASLSNFQNPSLPLQAYTPQWKQQILRMRDRIEKERTPRGKEALAIKTGAGGLMDVEFIAQTFCLEHGWHEPNTLRALKRAQEAKAAVGPDAVQDLISNYRQLRRIEGILRRWSFVGETELPDDPAALYRVAIRCGFPDAESFLTAVNAHRAAIRRIYSRVMS
jgi:glutamate-ammonia-ligase adenylyltransferase